MESSSFITDDVSPNISLLEALVKLCMIFTASLTLFVSLNFSNDKLQDNPIT